MEKNKILTLIVLGIVTVVMVFLLKSLVIDPTARVTELPEEEFIKIAPDTLEIQKDDLKHCCDVFDSEKGCWLMQKYDCELCKDYCG